MKPMIIIIAIISSSLCFGNITDIFKPRPAAYDVHIPITSHYALNVSQCSNIALMGLSLVGLTLIHKRPSVYPGGSIIFDENWFDKLRDYDHCDIAPWIMVGIIGLYRTLNAATINPLTRIDTHHDETNFDHDLPPSEQLIGAEPAA